MQPTHYSNRQSGLIGATDLIRSRPGSRRVRPVMPFEPAFTLEVGDVVDAVDSDWWSSSALVRGSG